MIRQFLAVVLLGAATDAVCPGGISSSEVKAILKSHNTLRANISKGKFFANTTKMPAAKKKIPALKWDCALEKTAQNVSNRCDNKHSEYRNEYLNENLFALGSSEKIKKAGMGKTASNAWKHEFQEFGWPSITFIADYANSDRLLTHATQMAWAKTTKIGCGITLCNGDKKALVACHYKDAGNWLGAPIYEPK